MELRNLSCCGAAELIGINDGGWNPEKWLLFYNDQFNLNYISTNRGKGWLPFCYAYDVSRKIGSRSMGLGNRRMNKWKKYIEDNSFGSVTIVEEHAYNPNYGKNVRLISGIFVPDNSAIRKFVTGVGGGKKFRETKAEQQAMWRNIDFS